LTRPRNIHRYRTAVKPKQRKQIVLQKKKNIRTLRRRNNTMKNLRQPRTSYVLLR